MDLEFDKEMDALLRKAAGRGVLVGDDANSHLDADTIAAFAENALPVKSRTIYTQHLAACDPCRMSLANLISINAAAEPATADAAAPVPAVSVPWYRKLFQAPNLAYVMGGLVLVFGGLLGVYVLQNSFSREATLSKVNEPQTLPTAPARAEAANALVTENANANTISNAAGEIPHSVGVADAPFGESNTAVATQPLTSTSTSNTADIALAKPTNLDSLAQSGVAGRSIAPAAAPPPAKEEAKREADERAKNEVRVATEQEARKQDNSASLYNNQQNQAQMMPGAGNKTAGPSRADVQRDNRDLNARQMDDLLVQGRSVEKKTAKSKDSSEASTRVVSGKTFELKQGAWYDTSFQGQATKNVQRGTDEFRKLDSGLRNIANSISGTVVIVWKGKAYRIQ